MLFQLSDLEYLIIDSLADGPEPLSLLLRELRDRQQPQAQAIIAALVELMEKQLARCTRTPDGPTFVNPPAGSLRQLALTPLGRSGPEYWFDLTESGQAAWETWRQLGPE